MRSIVGAVGTVADDSMYPSPYHPLPYKEITPEMIQPPTWVLDPYIPLNAITIWGGSTRNFKTTTALYVAAHIAAGKILWGLPVIQKKVLWLDEESGLTFVYTTLKKIVSRWDEASRKLFEENFFILSMEGVQLDKRNDRFDGMIEKLQPDIIFVDALRRIYAGEESTSDAINDLFTFAFKPLLADGRTLVLLHHNRKKNPNGPVNADADEAEDLRGSGDIPAMSGSIVALNRMKDEAKVILSQVKLRTGKERESHLFEIVITDDSLEILDDGIVAKEQAKAILAAKVITAWLILHRKLEVQTGEMKEAAEAAGYRGRTIEEAIKTLREEGKLIKHGKGKYEFCPPAGVDLKENSLAEWNAD